jgi:aspartyl-tRNA(Asn)/glutamyl-tRNA(Gln) amidotransferase subunit A
MRRAGVELAGEVNAGVLRPTELVQAAEDAYAASERGPAALNAFISVDFLSARRRAEGMEEEMRKGAPALALAGVPVALKDNLCTTEMPTTCGSRILEGYVSPFDATVVRLLREAGAIPVGKTNMDEFAMGSSTEHSAYGPVRNPLDPSRVPGGSSGGSAAAVAAGVVPFALGSDTGGSVRQPAAFCGIVGIKPTYGAVSRYGLVSFASSLDQVGTFGRTVTDAAVLLEVISGHDPLDATSVARAVPDYRVALGHGVEGMTIGVPEEYFAAALDPRVGAACRAALHVLEGMGAEVREISLPHTRHAVAAYQVVASAEASSNLARFDGIHFGRRAPDAATLDEVYERTRALFGAEAKRRIVLGTYVLSAGYYDAYYARAQQVRALVARDFQWAFASGVDAVFTPTTPTTAFRIGEVSDPYEMYLADAFTVPASLAGLPALSLPVGDVDGLPVGGQLIAAPWHEPKLIRIAHALETALAQRAAET